MVLRRILSRFGPGGGPVPDDPPPVLDVDPAYYDACYRAAMAPGERAEEHFRREGARRGFRPNAAFDPLAHAFQTGALPEAAADHARAHGPAPLTDLAELIPDIPRGIEEASPTAQKDHHRHGEDEVRRNNAAAANYAEGYETALEGENRSYRVFAPSSEAFLADMAAGRPFALVKLPHGFWDFDQFANRIAADLAGTPAVRGWSDEAVLRLARRRAAARYPANGLFAEYFIDEVQADGAAGLWDEEGLLIGLGFKGFPTWDNRIWHVRDYAPDAVARRTRALESLFPDGRRFWDSTVYKRWAITGDLFDMPSRLRHRPGLLLGSAFVADLPRRLDWSGLEHLEIEASNTHWKRHALYDACHARLSALSDGAEPPVFLSRAGASLMFWLIPRLRRDFPEVTYLDLGTAMNVWFLDRPDTVKGWTRIYWPTLTTSDRINAFYRGLGFRDLEHAQAIASN